MFDSEAAEPDLLTLREAAAVLGYTLKQLRTRIKAGAPVALKGDGGRGHGTVIRIAEFREWLAAKYPRQRRDIELRAMRRQTVVDVCAVVSETLAKTRDGNALAAVAGVRPELQGRLEGFMWITLTTALRAYAEADGGPALPAIVRRHT